DQLVETSLTCIKDPTCYSATEQHLPVQGPQGHRENVGSETLFLTRDGDDAFWVICRCNRIRDRFRPAQRAVLGCAASARKSVSRAHGRKRAARARLQGRVDCGRSEAGPARKLCSC